MSKAKRELTVPDPSSLELQALLGPAPLIEGEDGGAYDALAARIRASVEPRDVIEEIWVRDVVDNLWETLRLRRLKAHAMRASAADGLKELLAKLGGGFAHEYKRDAAEWASGDREAIKSVNASLKAAGLSQEAISAQTLATHIDTFERMDKMIMQTEMRRNVILREIDRHRDALARRLRDAAAEIEDAEFKELNPDGGAQ